ncbi:MarR family transcriptional regulator [Streptomyces sp. NPDC086010]|uniref:MarR family transcriptional regulator n=1 Tax=Streptomyces sp. NPDC086010 TaxID=3365745 RepID=UPI0037D1CDB4
MAIQHPSSAVRAPAPSRPYARANPGYGKRTVPSQRPSHLDDFTALPERERYVAGYVDHLPDGAAMDIKSLAKSLPLHGQAAVGSALRALSVAGHLRHARCPASLQDGQVRWVTLTFWSRTARDNEWWTAFIEVEGTRARTEQAAPVVAVPHQRTARTSDGSPSRVTGPTANPVAAPAATAAVAGDVTPVVAPETDAARTAAPALPAAVQAAAPPAPASASAPVPASASVPASAPSPAPIAGPGGQPRQHSAAYSALALLGRADPRLALSAADCAALEDLAAAWFERGVDTACFTHALTSGLPAQIGSPVGLLRRRLRDKIPPQLAPATATRAAEPPIRSLMVECTQCATPGRPDALPDGLCRPCRTAGRETDTAPPVVRDVAAHVGVLRDLMRLP